MDGHSPRPAPLGLRRHAVETLRLALPLAAAQLMQMGIGITDTVLLGGIGGEALAAGGLGGTIAFTVLVVLQGVLTAVSVLVAQARGAGQDAAVPALYWTGHVLTALLMLPAMAAFGLVAPLLRLAGEPAALVADVEQFLLVLRWSVPGSLVGIGLLRAFLPAVGGGGIILAVTAGETVVNAALCFGLIHGRWGLPAMGLRGAALATVVVATGSALAMLVLLHGSPGRRRFVGAARPSAALLGTMLRLGLPVAATFAVETGLFLAVGLLLGLLGPAALAAQQVALSTVSVAFMVPLALAQAANVRVGNHWGAGDRAGARRAGLVAIGLGAGAEGAAALVVLAFPAAIVGLFLGNEPSEAGAIAVRLLGVAMLFQVADGIQCVSAGALRGLGDTAVPFGLAALGYWGIGFPAAWWLTLRAGAGPEGAWYGLAAGLVVVAALLARRFLGRTRADRGRSTA